MPESLEEEPGRLGAGVLGVCSFEGVDGVLFLLAVGGGVAAVFNINGGGCEWLNSKGLRFSCFMPFILS